MAFKKAKLKKVFRLSESKRPRINTPSARVPKLVDQSEKPPFYIRGIKAGSKEEYWVSLSLTKIEELTGWSWEYQVPVNGGREIRGGNVVDFLVNTPGQKTALEPKGRYWHTGRHEDQTQMQQVARKKHWRLIEWFTDETPTKEAVHAYLRNQFSL